MPDPTPNMRALFTRAERVLGSPVASVAGGLAEALDEVERLRRLLADVVRGEDPCRFDHHGGCQEHGYLSLEPGERCPVGEVLEGVSAATSDSPQRWALGMRFDAPWRDAAPATTEAPASQPGGEE